MTASAAPPDKEVVDALEKLGGTLTFDPPEDWMPAYITLQRARDAILEAKRPAYITQFTALVVFVVFQFLAFGLPNYVVWLGAVLLMAAVLLAHRVVEIRFPLVKKLAEIDNTCRPFVDLVPIELRPADL